MPNLAVVSIKADVVIKMEYLRAKMPSIFFIGLARIFLGHVAHGAHVHVESIDMMLGEVADA